MISMKNQSKSWFPWQIDETLRGGEKYILFFRRLQSPTPSVEAVFATAYRIYFFTISTPKLNKILLILSNVYKFVPFYRSPSLFYISEKGSISVKMQASKQASKQAKQASKNLWFPWKSYDFEENPWKIHDFHQKFIKNQWFSWKINQKSILLRKIHDFYEKIMIFMKTPSKIHYFQ